MFLVIFQKLPFLNNTTHSHYRVEITKTAIPFWSSFVLAGFLPVVENYLRNRICAVHQRQCYNIGND